MLGQIIGAFVIIMIGFALLPMINDQVNQAVASTNTTSPVTDLLQQTNPFSLALIKTMPLFFGLTIIAIAILIAFRALRSSGLDEIDGDPQDESYEEPEKPKKLTYLGYVKERMAAERLLGGGIFTDWVYRIVIGLFFIIIILLIIYLSS